ncbi:MAG: cyclic nucleotide-binding domain-containing protein [Elusimicrobia bacterium]|nr:cyclic nucleotide-binding domain-containing protein [Elusimicrobiota bacterium]
MPGNAEAFFRTVYFFSGLSDAELHTLVESSEEVVSKPGRSIIMQGMTMEGLYVIERGSVAVWIKPKKGETTQVATLGAGEVFGERSIVELGTAGATIKAIEDTYLFLIRQEAFTKIMADDPSRRQFIVDRIAERRQRLASNPEIERKAAPPAPPTNPTA